MRHLKNINLKTRRTIYFLLPAALLVIAVVAYINIYYHADMSAMPPLTDEVKGIVCESDEDMIAFVPSEIRAGLIFYPGGKVEAEAYIPLVSRLAENGVLGVIVKMPLRLAFLDIDGADKVFNRWPEIDNWYMAGHSLGGVAGSEYVDRHPELFKGIIFLASYTTADLSDDSVSALSVYGSNDGVLNMKSYNRSLGKLPANTEFHVIDGGNHAQFGAYGAQRGDKTADISGEEQIDKTVEMILYFMCEE